MTEQDVVAAQGNLWASIKNYVPSTGEPWTPSEDLRQAFFACPRHQFCHAFSLADRSASYNADDWASRADWLPQVYRNSTLVYLDDGGKPLPSTSSEPAFILYLVSVCSRSVPAAAGSCPCWAGSSERTATPPAWSPLRCSPSAARRTWKSLG